MGARAGRKGSRTYNILTCGVGSWRKYLDKKRRKAAKRAAIEEQEFDPECICGLIIPNPEACKCGCGCCIRPDCDCEEEDND